MAPVAPDRTTDPSPTGPLARAEAARDQAEELLTNAQQALDDNHATMERLRAELSGAQAPRQDSMLAAAKLSLKEAERFEASAEEVERSRSNDCSVGSLDAERVEHLRQLGRDELLLANAQASIAVAEALATDKYDDAPDPDYSETEHTVDGEEFKQAVRNAIRDKRALGAMDAAEGSLSAYRAYLDAYAEYAPLVGTWRELLGTPRFRRALHAQSAAWKSYQRLADDPART